MKFTPTQDFWSDEMKSMYCAGMTYTVRAATDPAVQGEDKKSKHIRAQRAKLAQLVADWRRDGKIKVADSDVPEAAVSGAGEVN